MSWLLLALFAAPTILVMVSWNTFPGDSLYGVKLGLEQFFLLSASPSYEMQAGLNVRYTDRRLHEARVLLAKDQSGEGLSYLTHQIKATKVVIEKAPDMTTKQSISRQYISELQSAASELELDRQQLSITHESVITITPTDVVSTQLVSTVSSESDPIKDTGVLKEIEETQEVIRETIDDLSRFGQDNQKTFDEPMPSSTQAPPVTSPVREQLPSALIPTASENHEKGTDTKDKEDEVIDTYEKDPGSETE